MDGEKTNNGFVVSDGDKINEKAIVVKKSDPENNEIDEENRPTWGRSIEFLMSCVSLSVGLGNVWRFPFTAYSNGGGAFLIPYIICLVLIGKPMYYMEMCLGQFTSRGNVRIWEVAPILKGIGCGQIICTISVLSYYCSLIALTLNYLFSSFTSELPWIKCLASWGDNCVDSTTTPRVMARASFAGNQSVSSSELYFLNEVLKEKDDITDGIGLPDLKLTLYLLLAWSIVFLVIVRGVKSSGKVSYFLALFPYVVMITILVRGVTLEGSIDGILFFLKPQWGELLNPKVWYSATTQVFYSLSLGTGSIIMFSSYNRFSHNIYRDALIVTTLDTFTSLLAGMTIFAILGNLAYNLDIKDIGTVVKAGSSLAFISYPDAIAKFEVWPQFFAVLFFVMLAVLGIGSAVALCSSVTTVIYDEFPNVAYWKIAGSATSTGFLLGLCYLTPGGQWMLNLVDHFGGTFLVFALAIIETLAIFWVYGLENFCDDIEFMLKRKVTMFWRLSWSIVTPGIMLIIFVYYMANLEAPNYSGWAFPKGYLVFGWILFAVGVLQVPLWILWFMIRKRDLPIREGLKEGTTPSIHWGPKNPKDQKAWMAHKVEAKKRRAESGNNLTYWQQKIRLLKGH